MTLSITDTMVALAAQIDSELSPLVENLQVLPGQIWNITPPAIDVYPGDPLEELVAFSRAKQTNLTVRLRVDTPDIEGAQELILSMMDSSLPTSVEQAILSDDTLGGQVGQVNVESGPHGYGEYIAPDGQKYLATEWLVTVLR